MAQWLVLQGKDNQFSVDGMRALRTMAKKGELRLGDLIQPPGTSEWLYVDEVSELKQLCPPSAGLPLEEPVVRGTNTTLIMVLAGFFVAIILVGGFFAWTSVQELPRGDERLIGEGGLTYAEMLVTETGTGLRSDASPSASVSTSVKKDQILDLLSKRRNFYRARTKGGAEGWIPHDHVIPIYQLGGEDVREEFDPLYNPDRYFEVVNGGVQQLPDAEEGVTVFQFFLSNSSRYDMTDLVILATLKDGRGLEVEQIEIPVEGIIPSGGRTMVGTLLSEEAEKKRGRRGDEEEVPPPRTLTEHTFTTLAEEDPELQLLYSAGTEVVVTAEDFVTAQIDTLELRAIPTEDALKRMRKP